MAQSGLEGSKNWSAPGVLVLDDSAAPDEEALHRAWRLWLHIYNTTQTLPGMWLTTASGLKSHDPTPLAAVSNGSPAQPGVPANHSALEGAWDETLAQVMEPLRVGLRKLAQAGANIPEVSHELLDAKGQVVADCELCWVCEQLVLLREDQADMHDAWVSQAWKVLQLDESMAKIDDTEWFNTVARQLGLTLSTQE